MTDDQFGVESFQPLDRYTQVVFREDTDRVGGEETSELFPDDDLGDFHDLMDEIIRDRFSDHIDELRGDADELCITNVEIPADDLPRIEYRLIHEER